MEPLSATASVIAILQLSAKVLTYLNDVNDSSKGYAQCAMEASNLHNLLTNLRFRLEEGHDRQPWFNKVQALATENGPLDQFKQALEILQAKMTDGGRLRRIGEALKWKFKKEEIDDILARMERLKTLVEIALQMDHFNLSQAIKDDTGSIRMHALVIESAVDTLRQAQITASQRILLEWMSSRDYPAQQSDIIRRRQEGTGQWFLDATEVARWLNHAKTTLFCPGIPGAGKTMVAAIAVDHLLNSAQNYACGVAYVYCNYKSQADQDIVSILAAILKQLVQSRPAMLSSVEKLQQKHAARGTKPSLDDIYSALRDMLAQYPCVYIVVDALDECEKETRRQLCIKLLDLQREADVRLMLTSRFVPDVEDAFRLALRLEVKASDKDVKLFVAGQIHRLPGCVQRSADLQELVQERVVEAVGGMFLLARLHIESISDNTTAKGVKSTLAALSKGAAALDGAYSEALERIEGQRASHSKLAKNVLTWIIFAKRPLTTAELCCALAVEPGEAELDPENKPHIDDIVSVCAGLVVVDQESAIIRLVHYTTQEYFERVSSRLNPDGQLVVAQTCLSYLCFSVFESGSCATDEEYEERLRQHELLNYAAKHCGEHARSVDGKVASLTYALVTHSGTFSCAAQVLLVPSYKYKGYSGRIPAVTGLHWIARFGLCGAAKEYLRREEDQMLAVNAMDSNGEGSLMYAVKHGHVAMAELLLDRGADVNVQGGDFGNALQVASYGGHEAIAKLLLDKGADLESTDKKQARTPLSWAATNGHEAVAKLLLDKGADRESKDKRYVRTPLSWAATNGHDAVVNLLLEDADTESKDGNGQTPLSLAATDGHEAVVEMLLEKGSDVGSRDRYGRTPLWWATTNRHVAIAKLLHEKGAVLEPEDQVRFAFTGQYRLEEEEVTISGASASRPDNGALRTRGTVGLANLGNTGWMNSALQCIRSVEELAAYFLQAEYKQDINTTNPIGYRGAIAKEYAYLLAVIYREEGITSFAPESLRYRISRANFWFARFEQQDAQEFLSWFLDALHEDLNRIKRKPYVENPASDDKTVNDPKAIKALGDEFRSNHRSRNDSVIMDLFLGSYKVTMTCPKCGRVSITFEPYSSLTLELPTERTGQSTVRINLVGCFAETYKATVCSEDNAWYCNCCKELRCAEKEVEIWTAPDILLIHLKRYSGSRSRGKINVLVDFPTEGLDLTDRVGLPEEKQLVYDLFAVINHYEDGPGRGVVTAFVKNFFDQQWYYYNSTWTNPNGVITSAAYLLFYRRRSNEPLGPPKLREIVHAWRNSGYKGIDDAEQDDFRSTSSMRNDL